MPENLNGLPEDDEKVTTDPTSPEDDETEVDVPSEIPESEDGEPIDPEEPGDGEDGELVDPEEPEEPEVDPEEPGDGEDGEPIDPEEPEVPEEPQGPTLLDLVNSIQGRIIVPTRPMNDVYILAEIKNRLNSIVGGEDIEYELSPESKDSFPSTEEPMSVLISFYKGDEAEELSFDVTTILYEKLQMESEKDYVYKTDEENTDGAINEYFERIYGILDITKDTVVANFDRESSTVEIGYNDYTIKSLEVNLIPYITNVDPYPLVNEEYDLSVMELLKAGNVDVEDMEAVNEVIELVFDEKGVIGLNILQHSYTREFLIVPLTYRFEGETIRYTMIISRLYVSGILGWDDDGDQSSLYPPNSQQAPNQRFAFSLLSRDRAASASKQEVMVEKNIGEFLVKDPVGNVVSMSKLSRQQTFLRSFITDMKLKGVYGDVVRIESSNRVLPTVLLDGESYVKDTILSGGILPVSIGIMIDVDTILLGLDSTLASEPSKVEAVIEVTLPEVGTREIKSETTAEKMLIVPILASLGLDISEAMEYVTGTVENNEEIKVELKSLKVTVSDKYADRNVRMALHDILAFNQIHKEE